MGDVGLENRAPSTDTLLGQMLKGRFFLSLKDNCPDELKDQVDKLLDPSTLQWERLRHRVIESIAANAAQSKGTLAHRTRSHAAKKFEFYDKFTEDGINGLPIDKDSTKGAMLKSLIGLLASEFVQLLEFGVVKGDTNVEKRAREILAVPVDVGALPRLEAETLYYLAGWSVFACKKASKGRKGKLGDTLKNLAKGAMVERETAKCDNRLPCDKTEETEKYDGLTYVSFEFFGFFVTIESIHKEMLKPSNLAVYGASMVKSLHECLALLLLDDFTAFLGDGTSEDLASKTFKVFLSYFGRMRIKDFVMKCNARAGSNVTVQLRNEMAAISNAKLRKKTENGAMASSGVTKSSQDVGGTAGTFRSISVASSPLKPFFQLL